MRTDLGIFINLASVAMLAIFREVRDTVGDFERRSGQIQSPAKITSEFFYTDILGDFFLTMGRLRSSFCFQGIRALARISPSLASECQTANKFSCVGVRKKTDLLSCRVQVACNILMGGLFFIYLPLYSFHSI